MTFKINQKSRLLIGSAINHLKLAATAVTPNEFDNEVRSAIRAVMGASSAANPSELDKKIGQGLELNDEIIRLLTGKLPTDAGVAGQPQEKPAGK